MDEKVEMLDQIDVEMLKIQTGKVSKSGKQKKTSMTLYLTEEAENALLELYIQRLRKDRKAEKSQIACDAIIALYERESKGSSQ